MRTIALLGLLALACPAWAADIDPVTYVASTTTAEAFAKGQPLIETSTYKVHASRREGDGLVEVHATETDIVYVLDGTATLVTGGDVVNPRTIAVNEVGGDGVTGGVVRTLQKGDVVVVPRGVPHWFRDVRAPFLYYVVKVIEQGATAP